MKRLIGLVLLACGACTAFPPKGTPYFSHTISGDSLYPATETRIYATDQYVATQAPHPLNRDRGETAISTRPGAFAAGVYAFQTFPPPTEADFQTFAPGQAPCCHASAETRYDYFDGDTLHATTEAVWRQAIGKAPFVD